MQSFLRFVNFYWRFIDNYSSIVTPLTHYWNTYNGLIQITKNIVYSLTILAIDVGKDSHIKRLINNVSGCLDCGATDYDVTDGLDPLLHKYDIIVELNRAK